MTLRHVQGAITAVAFTCGVMTIGPAYAQLRDGGLLPQDESGLITVVGCFLRGGDVRGGPDGEGRYVLALPKRGPVNSVPTETCTADAGANALELQDTGKLGMNDWMLGRAIEISGRLEKETSTDPDNLRELEVRSFRVVPVVPPAPRVAAAPPPAREPVFQQPLAPVIEEQPRARALETPAPVATTGEEPARLPKTASYLAASGLVGLLTIAGGLALRSYRTRERW